MIDEFTVTMQPPAVLDVTMNPAAVLEVTFSQQQGIAGPASTVPGPAGPMGTTYPFAQSMPASVWTIVHGLDRYPSVTVIDSAGEEIDGDVRYVDANTITVTFAAPFSGDAYLN